jgi:hypothetical protein
MRSTNRPSLKDVYVEWLAHELTSASTRQDKSYLELAHVMFEVEFTWLDSIPMDENRAGDGMEIRYEFGELHRISRGDMRRLGNCTFLEVLIGLSRRVAFVCGGDAHHWAWQLLVNIGLERMWDHMSRPKRHATVEILHTVMERQYAPDGSGGFFPLAWPQRDQREVELWYQLNAYAEEQHPEH